MKFLALNALSFAKEISHLGHEVDQILLKGQETLPSILQTFQQKHSCLPDMILISSLGNTPLPTGMADSPCPVAAYFMDSCLNEFWIKHYCHLCHKVFVDQQSSVKALEAEGILAKWLPLSVPKNLFLPQVPEQDKMYDLVFVGRFHAHRIKRNNLIALLEKHFPIHIVGREGEYISTYDMVQLFSKSKIVINENLFDGLTLRVFQALASGSVLLTEESQSMHALLQPTKHLLTYTPETLLAQVDYALSHPVQRQQIAFAGQQVCLQAHSHSNRAQDFLATLMADSQCASQKKPDTMAKKFHEAAAHYALEQRYPERNNLVYCGKAIQELCVQASPPQGARFLYALMCARGHIPDCCLEQNTHAPRIQQFSETAQNSTMLEQQDHNDTHKHPKNLNAKNCHASTVAAYIDDQNFLLASNEAQGWLAALSWGYALAKAPNVSAQIKEKALPAFQLAIKGILDSFTKTENLLQACHRLLETVAKNEKAWALDMSMAHMYIALNIYFETGFSKAKPENIPQCAAEFLAKVLADHQSFEAHLLLAYCYKQCKLPTEEAYQYLQMRPYLKDFPELHSKIQDSENLLYVHALECASKAHI